MSDQPAQRARGTGFWVLAALVVSIAVNAFFIGSMVGARLPLDRGPFGAHHGHGDGYSGPPGPVGAPGEFDPRRIVHVLPESARADAVTIIHERAPEIRALIDEAAAARDSSIAALRAAPYDRAMVEAAFAEGRAADMALVAGMQDLIIEIVDGLSAEERAAVTEHMSERVRFGRHHDRRGRRHERWEERRERRERFEEWRGGNDEAPDGE